MFLSACSSPLCVCGTRLIRLWLRYAPASRRSQEVEIEPFEAYKSVSRDRRANLSASLMRSVPSGTFLAVCVGCDTRLCRFVAVRPRIGPQPAAHAYVMPPSASITGAITLPREYGSQSRNTKQRCSRKASRCEARKRLRLRLTRMARRVCWCSTGNCESPMLEHPEVRGC